MRTETQPQAAKNAVLRINARAWGISTGLLVGLSIFLATNALIRKGGPNGGQHLRLLSIYFPGYTVTFVGSLIGFVYGFVLGYGLGRVIGVVYNRTAGL